jgi:hypothetical protein
MKPFQKAYYPPDQIEAMRKQLGISHEELAEMNRGLVFKNDLYQVLVRRVDYYIVLSIKRLDRQPIMDWRHIQEIKNMLVGPEHEAVQLFPAESRLVDSANQYWLFCLPNKGERWPFGFDQRLVDDTISVGKSKQRKLTKEKS